MVIERLWRTFMPTVGEIVRQKREEKGLTLAVLAKAVGATKGYLSMIENHRVANPPSHEIILGLEKALGLTGGELERAAAWQSTPAPVRRKFEEVASIAERGAEFAQWLKQTTEQRGDGARGLDKLHKSGELARRIEGLLGEEPKKGSRKKGRGAGRAAPALVFEDALSLGQRVPIINRVAAGYPRDFTDLDYPRNVADEYTSVPGMTDPDAFAARVVGDSMTPDFREGDIVVFSPAAKIEDGSDCFFRLEPDHETTFKRVFFEKNGAVRLQPLNPAYPPRVLNREQISGMYRAVWRFTPLA
jgi:SOS-response transcriptional repressor LexA